ncbi:MFS transporter [Sporolactobacillus kofuensis]|uniref:MFS transporter n=1 Tax=Sporolactobacillus kofuensis TaxID=269672 RepID=A0ABW1WEN8_9BACL|nr:MFS transporter [Sporolactobacillus kofuensis]MCO7175221.1 MFS transporter [Sporolactobacillus kofuensis]
MENHNYFRLKTVLYLNYLVHGMGLIILTQNMNALSQSWHTPLATVSYVISGVGIGRLFAYYVLGSLSDKYGRKFFIATGMVMYTIFFIGMAFTTDFRIAYGLAILAGIANSALDSGTYPTFLELKGENGSANILIKAAMSLGEFVLPILIGLNETIKGWYGIIFILVGVILVANLLMLIRLQFPQQTQLRANANQQSAQPVKRSGARVGLFMILSFYGYSSMALMILFTQWITLYGTEVLHMSNMAAHFLLSLYSIGSITGVLLIFVLLRRSINPMKLVAVMNGLSFLLMLMICFSGNSFIVSICSLLFGVTAAGGVMQVGLNVFGSLFPEKKGKITGIFFSFGSLASFTIPIITGMLSQISLSLVLRVDVVIALLSFIFCLIGQHLMLLVDHPAPYEKERRQINRIDYWIIRLLNRRFRLTQEIGIKKLEQQRDVYDPEREQVIMDRIDRQVADTENRQYCKEIYQTIINRSKNNQIHVREKGQIK